MYRRFALAALLLTCMLLRTAPAAEDVLKLVPQSASAVLLINNPTATDARLQELGRAMQLPVPSPLAMLKLRLNLQEGLDESRAVALAVLGSFGEGKMPASMLFVPVSDYDKFLKPFSKKPGTADQLTEVEIFHTTLLARHVDGYAVLGDKSHRDALVALKPSRKTSESLAPWQDWAGAGDVAVVVLRPGVEQLSATLQQQIAKFKAAMPQANEQMKTAAAVFDFYSKLFQAMDREVSAFGLRLQLDENNVVRLAKRVSLVPGGQWARLAAKLPPPQADLLEGLPAEPFVLAGGGVISDAMWQAMMKWSLGIIKAMPGIYGLNEKQAAKFSQISVQSFKGVRAMSMMLGVGKKDEPLYAATAATMEVEDSQAFMDGYARYLKQYNEIVEGLHSPVLQPMEVADVEVDGKRAFEITMEMPQLPGNVPAANYTKMMEAFFGPGGKLVIYVAVADEHHVVMSYVNKNRLLETIKTIKQGAPGMAGEAEVKTTAALLPKDALAVGYLSPRGTFEFVRRMLAAVFPPELKIQFKLPEFPKTPPIGFAVRKDSEAIEGSMVIPGEVLLAIQPYIVKIQTAESRQPAVTAPAPKRRPPGKPQALDISQFYNTKGNQKEILEAFYGRPKIDGLPFSAEGMARLWGETIADRNPKSDLPETWNGIAVGRPFEELHLIHFALWPDVDGRTIAYYLLNYDDGTKAILPIRYGVQVLDWMYLPSYDQELPTGGDTKVCWRRSSVVYKAPIRLFQTKLVNPSPDKVVKTIDVVSGRGLSTYALCAATVADINPDRPVTPLLLATGPKRKFDGKLVIRVVDKATGKPIKGALLQPGETVEDEGVVAQPLFTSATGEATLCYRTQETTRLSVSVRTDGYLPDWRNWAGDVPESVTIELRQTNVRYR